MSCECTTVCGDDPNVQARRVLGCASYRALRSPRALAASNAKLRATLAGLVGLMDRMEPDVDDAVRELAETEWDRRKAEAKQLLAETE